MRLVKENGQWVKYLQATCRNCDTRIERKADKPFRGGKCPKCGVHSSKEYFE